MLSIFFVSGCPHKVSDEDLKDIDNSKWEMFCVGTIKNLYITQRPFGYTVYNCIVFSDDTLKILRNVHNFEKLNIGDTIILYRIRNNIFRSGENYIWVKMEE